jgi:hypothetical protein
MDPSHVRKTVIKAAQQGKNVGIIGCGWDALDLAVASAQARGGRRKRGQTSLIYGSAGPVSHILPQYLFSAVAKRLRSKRIDVQDRTLIRYVSLDDHTKKLGVYTAKAYDVLDTLRSSLDYLVVAPEVNGSRGNALLPTNRVSFHLLDDNSEGRPWYETWAQLSIPPSSNRTDPAMLICYQEDGRVAYQRPTRGTDQRNINLQRESGQVV